MKSKIRNWMRDNSKIWARFDPHMTYSCGCGEKFRAEMNTHAIGKVFYPKQTKTLMCDGAEVE